jgi:hypothetical protein
MFHCTVGNIRQTEKEERGSSNIETEEEEERQQ